MPVIFRANEGDGHEEYLFPCPGCGFLHSYVVKWGQRSLDYRRDRAARLGKPFAAPPQWSFNGDMEKPTFSPSLLYYRAEGVKQCHLYVKEGQLQYLSDCDHELAGKTIPMKDISTEP